MVPRSNNIKLVRLVTPKKTTVSCGRLFMSKHERRKKNDLPLNVTIRSKYKKELGKEDRDDVVFKGVREK